MSQNDLFEKLYGEPPIEEQEEGPPVKRFTIQSRQARSFLESLKEDEA